MGHIFPFSPQAGHAGRAHAAGRPRRWSRRAPAGCARRRRGARRPGCRAWSAARQRCWSSARTAPAMPRISRRCGSPAPAIGAIVHGCASTRSTSDMLIGVRCVSESTWYERLRGGLPQDLRTARRQSHRPVHQGGARQRDARRDRGGADRVRPRPRDRRQDPRRGWRTSGSSAGSTERGCAKSSPRRSRRSCARSPSRSRSTPSRARR